MSQARGHPSKRDRVARFLRRFAEARPAYFAEIRRSLDSHRELFHELAEPMLEWAELTLGPDFIATLVDGYCEFVTDVNRSQLRYEASGEYPARSYDEVFAQTYDSAQFMSPYHWGVYTTTFAWGHHLRLYEFFRSAFLPRLDRCAAEGAIIDLGCGSGVWHLLALRHRAGWRATAVDISETSIALTREMSQAAPDGGRVTHVLDDALTFRPGREFEAGLSCFLLEHLEQPAALLENLAACLKDRGHAFVTCALTAAEVDHIYEFRRESEVVEMAEEAGFRVTALLSAAPGSRREDSRFLPRSMAMLLQKKRNEIW